jgi:hypothetical protein
MIISHSATGKNIWILSIKIRVRPFKILNAVAYQADAYLELIPIPVKREDIIKDLSAWVTFKQ